MDFAQGLADDGQEWAMHKETWKNQESRNGRKIRKSDLAIGRQLQNKVVSDSVRESCTWNLISCDSCGSAQGPEQQIQPKNTKKKNGSIKNNKTCKSEVSFPQCCSGGGCHGGEPGEQNVGSWNIAGHHKRSTRDCTTQLRPEGV